MAFSNQKEIQKLMKEKLGRASTRVIFNPGDGAAVLRFSGKKMILCNSTMIEGVHFDLSYMTARELGHKSLAVSLSSVAAMGGEPQFASVSVGLRQDQGDIFLEELFSGFIHLAKIQKMDVVGENTIPSPSFSVVNVTTVALGKDEHFSPSGAKVGDLLFVTGGLGGSAAGLSLLKRLGRAEAYKAEEAVAQHLTPVPKVREAALLLKAGGVTAMVDLQDGLARDIYRLAELSNVGAEIEEEKIPVSQAALQVSKVIQSNPKAWALYGGEDYELLFSVRPAQAEKIMKAMKAKKVPVTLIGRIMPVRYKIKLRNLAGDLVPFLPKLWSHYARRARLH